MASIRPLPPLSPELRYSALQPRGPHGKWIKGAESLLAKVEHKPPAAAAPAPPADIAAAIKPMLPFDNRYSAEFTPAMDQAAQLAAKRQLLAFSQKRIMDALSTPPEQMTDEQVELATRVIGRLTSNQIDDSVDQLRHGGVPDSVVSHVHAKIAALRKDIASDQNADAKQKVITHVAAIGAAVALSLGSLGLALPAALAAIIAAFPSLAQEFIDFKADYQTRRAAVKAAQKAAQAGAAPVTPRSFRPVAELRTAETPVLSSVHHPFGSPSGPGLFRVKGLQLPAYIQNVAHAFTRSGTPESEAIARAIGVVRDWAQGRTPDGKGHVHPDVRAAAIKAIAEWDAAKAAAHGSK